MTNQNDIKKLAQQMAGSMKSEPPRLYRRAFYLSQATLPDSLRLS